MKKGEKNLKGEDVPAQNTAPTKYPPPFIEAVGKMRKTLLEFSSEPEECDNLMEDQVSPMRVYISQKYGLTSKVSKASSFLNKRL